MSKPKSFVDTANDTTIPVDERIKLLKEEMTYCERALVRMKQLMESLQMEKMKQEIKNPQALVDAYINRVKDEYSNNEDEDGKTYYTMTLYLPTERKFFWSDHCYIIAPTREEEKAFKILGLKYEFEERRGRRSFH